MIKTIKEFFNFKGSFDTELSKGLREAIERLGSVEKPSSSYKRCYNRLVNILNKVNDDPNTFKIQCGSSMISKLIFCTSLGKREVCFNFTSSHLKSILYSKFEDGSKYSLENELFRIVCRDDNLIVESLFGDMSPSAIKSALDEVDNLLDEDLIKEAANRLIKESISSKFIEEMGKE